MKRKSLPVKWINKHRFGFLAQMLQQQEPLLLVRGGYWTLRSLSGWHTDIDVVAEADGQGYLVKRFSESDGSLDGRSLTSKGEAFATDLLRKSPTTAESRPRRKTEPTVSRGRTVKPSEPIRPPALTSKALELLRQIEAEILADPNSFTLRACCESIPQFKARAYPAKYPRGGTISCLAGLACLAITKSKNYDGSKFLNRSHADLAAVAADELGLAPGEANRLFAHWSFDFLVQYRDAASPQDRAKTAVERIERFIKTGE